MSNLVGISMPLVAAILAFVVLDIFAIGFGLSFVRANRAARESPGGQIEVTSKPVASVSRRDFFRRSLLNSLMLFGAVFGGASITFLWPNLKGGFGSLVDAGSVDDLKAEINTEAGVAYNGTGRFYVVGYNGGVSGDVDYVTDGVSAEGIMPLYQRCVHLGCRVPYCSSSKWFECPCHGSKYNGAGEYQLGPAPRGMDRFKLEIVDGVVVVDTSEVVLGPPRGTDTVSQPPQGPFCVATG
ncbi:MAG: Rieske 2Fe-2S domain-containing protein [Actinomycetota bacterium]